MTMRNCLHLVQQRLPGTVQRPLQRQIVAGVVHAEHAALGVDVLQKQLRLLQPHAAALEGRRDLKPEFLRAL